jgi:hypothetical protein
MSTVTIKVNDNALMAALIKVFESLNISFVVRNDKKVKYSKEFLKRIENADKEYKNGTLTPLNPDNIWEAIS